MEFLEGILPIILYFLGAVLLVLIIVLVVNLIETVKKTNILLDDVESKMQSLNGMFNAIDSVSDTISSVNMKMVGVITNIVEKVFKRRKKKYNHIEEEEDYE